MQQAFFFKPILTLCSGLMLAACTTTPAPDFGGRWKPVNRFDTAPTEIPLHSSYAFQASPMDGTLKAMLERWARDSGMRLEYRLASDYTLHAGVARISTTSAQQAMSDVSAAYAAQGVVVSIVGNDIVVGTAAQLPAAPPTASTGTRPAPADQTGSGS